MNLIKLESVSSFFDKDSGLVYPMLLDGTIDLMKGSAYHILYDTGGFDEDGFELYNLADLKDREVIEEYLETTK